MGSTHKTRWKSHVCSECGETVQVLEEALINLNLGDEGPGVDFDEDWIPAHGKGGRTWCPGCGAALEPVYG